MLTARFSSAQALLKKINTEGYKAVIAGGYARDAICDRPIRDIDLYVCDDDYADVRELLIEEDLTDIQLFSDDSPEYQHQYIRRQQEFKLRLDYCEDLPTNVVNLIGLAEHMKDGNLNVRAVIERFNLGICKAGIELTSGRCVIGDEFRRDYKDKQITLYRLDWGHEASMKQFIKLQSKYPWPLRLNKQECDLDAL